MLKKFVRTAIGLALTFGAVAMSTAASAAVTYSFTNGTRAASATFDISGQDLFVTLTNTSASDVLVPTDVLTALFFDFGTTLTPISATLPTGSFVFGDADFSGTNVAGEWAYNTGLNVGGYNTGISSIGTGIFGPSDRFDTTRNEAGPTTPNGLQYGIVSAGDDTATGNGGITGAGGLIKNSVSFVLSFTGQHTLSEIGDTVRFQYGTSTTEPSFEGGCERPGGCGSNEVPEPGSLALLGALAALGAIARRRWN